MGRGACRGFDEELSSLADSRRFRNPALGSRRVYRRVPRPLDSFQWIGDRRNRFTVHTATAELSFEEIDGVHPREYLP